MIPRELPAAWRERASSLEPYAPAAATAYSRAAEELEQALHGSEMEALTLEQAEVESGYTRAHLRRLLTEGRVPNSGTAREPRILRVHLPRKPGYRMGHGPVSARVQDANLRSQVARAVAGGE